MNPPGLRMLRGGGSLYGHSSSIHKQCHFKPRSLPVSLARRKATAAPPSSDPGDSMDPETRARKENIRIGMEKIRGKYGPNSIFIMGERPRATEETFSSGCMPLDIALGGGYPMGRIVEIFGPESSGKTTLALHAIAEAQKKNMEVMFIDAEHALDETYANRLGVNTKTLAIVQPDCGEQALDCVDDMARHGMQLIVVDSVSALVPKAELDNDVGVQTVGMQARLLSAALRKLVGSAATGKCTIMFINQLRFKINSGYGNPETTSGGNALKYYASVRIDVRKKEVVGSAENPSGIKVQAKVVKNKMAAPFRKAMFSIMFNGGIDRVGCILDAAEAAEVITRRGAWIFYEGTQLAQGREKAIEKLRQDPELLKLIEDQVKKAIETHPAAEGLIASYDADGSGGLEGFDLGEMDVGDFEEDVGRGRDSYGSP